ncbi:MAG TPA: zinc ribbon domain-containing protein [Thermoanaerobaculia bacterium]|nr:zinc ribbon domain-containing protein [Thermoanaerobaculia bacterium]
MTETDKKECRACRHEIDATAKLCPYCGADPETAERFDATPLLRKHFPMKDGSGRERALEFLRERQALVVTAVVIGVFFVLGLAHQYIVRWNAAAEARMPAVPLTELADLNEGGAQEELPIPELEFEYIGRPETMGVWLIEPGAVAPPPPPAQITPTPAPQGSGQQGPVRKAPAQPAQQPPPGGAGAPPPATPPS